MDTQKVLNVIWDHETSSYCMEFFQFGSKVASVQVGFEGKIPILEDIEYVGELNDDDRKRIRDRASRLAEMLEE